MARRQEGQGENRQRRLARPCAHEQIYVPSWLCHGFSSARPRPARARIATGNHVIPHVSQTASPTRVARGGTGKGEGGGQSAEGYTLNDVGLRDVVRAGGGRNGRECTL
ncbi:hypothetical protein DFH11DRAFT_1550039 [Phellopilus nigrolimitatus]|nr:hypothetical protein DFH11DRAFT_1550039 [Phellopilus nigrolimitatus]